MNELARALGFANMIAGLMFLTFPSFARQIMQARNEFSRLSDGALRVLGLWVCLTGAALTWATARREIESLIGEALMPGRRPIE